MSKEQPVAWKTPYFESTRSGDLTPICVWGERHEDDWKPLYPASALDAAFRRGLERAAEVADIFAKTSAIVGPEAALIATVMSGTGAKIAAAIRALAEEPERNNNAHRT